MGPTGLGAASGQTGGGVGGVAEEAVRTLAAVQRDFRNPELEGRRMFAEAFGTYFLVLVAAGGSVVNAVSGGQIPLAAQVTAPGLMVMAIILFMGATSGAHLNPAVTVAFAARGDFPWRRVPGYIVAQLLGALAAAGTLAALFGHAGELGATLPPPGITDLQAVVIEALLTLGLVSTILGTASRAQSVGALAALAVGGYIILAGIWAAPVSGASMNPARSLGPALVLGDLAHAWIYILGPIVGALLAVAVAYILRGPGGDLPAVLAAQGRLHEILRESDQEAKMSRIGSAPRRDVVPDPTTSAPPSPPSTDASRRSSKRDGTRAPRTRPDEEGVSDLPVGPPDA